MIIKYLFFLVLVATVHAEKIFDGIAGQINVIDSVHFSELPFSDIKNNNQKVVTFKPIPNGLPKEDCPTLSKQKNDDSCNGLKTLSAALYKKSCCNSCFNINPPVPIIPPVQPATAIPGVGDSGDVIPPDTQGAVGPNHLVITLNSVIAIQDKTGKLLRSVTLNSFWASKGKPDAFDPRITYDPYGKRWIMISCANAGTVNSSLLIAVTQTTNPLGVWNLYRVDVDSANKVWIDNATVGFNKNWITVQGNMFNVSDSNFNGSHIYVFNKSRLYANKSATFKLFSNSNIGGSQIPAQTYDATLGTQYLVQTWNNNANGKGLLRLYNITGAIGSEQFAPVAFVTSSVPWQNTHPIINKGFAPQARTTLRIMNNDDRIQKVVYRNGFIWATQTIFLPATGTPTRSGVQWWQFNVAGTIKQIGRIQDSLATATNGRFFYAFPSIAVNQQNDALLGFTRYSSNTFASAAYSYRLGTDSLNSMRTPKVFKAGLAPYTKDFGGGQIRWGDYSNAVVDPINDRDMWTIQEYAGALSGSTSQWAVEWAKLSVAVRGLSDILNDDNVNE